MKKTKVLEIIGDATLAGAPRHLLSLLENFLFLSSARPDHWPEKSGVLKKLSI